MQRGRLEALVRQHQAMVWRYLRLLGADAEEADDLMQETFLRIARGSNAGETLHAPAAFLRAVARNLLVGARRQAQRRTPTTGWLDAADQLAADVPQAFDGARLDALRLCLTRLTGRSRAAIGLHHVEGLSYRGAASRLGITPHGIKSLLTRARQQLRECVTQRLQRDER